MPTDPSPDWPAIEAARAALDLSLDALWVAYVSVGGNGTPSDVRRWLCGAHALDGRDGTLLAQAIHDETVGRTGPAPSAG